MELTPEQRRQAQEACSTAAGLIRAAASNDVAGMFGVLGPLAHHDSSGNGELSGLLIALARTGGELAKLIEPGYSGDLWADIGLRVQPPEVGNG